MGQVVNLRRVVNPPPAWCDGRSVYFAYFASFFALSAGLTVYFFVRSRKDGYWGKEGEEIKYQVFDEREKHGTHKTQD